MIIAIDGPAAAGKGTLARGLAAKLRLAHLDTGRIYRAVGLAVLRAGGDPEDEIAAQKAAESLDPAELGDPELGSDRAGGAASKVAAIPNVRIALLAFQRQFAEHPPGPVRGAVLDGRDIGTVVCPNADVKLFVSASAEARATRRHKELMGRGEASIYARVLADIEERDLRDSKRAVAPLVPAADAILIDTTIMDAERALAAALEHIPNFS